MGDIASVYKISVSEPQEKKTLERPGLRWKFNINRGIKNNITFLRRAGRILKMHQYIMRSKQTS